MGERRRHLMQRVCEAAYDEDVMASGFQSRHQTGAQQRAFTDARPPVQDKRAVRDNLRRNTFDFRLSAEEQLRIALGIVIKKLVGPRARLRLMDAALN